MTTQRKTTFPKHFLWGASTSAHQVEGNNHNQWSVWELENAKSLATQAPYHYGDLEVWKDISHEAKRPANYVSGPAVNHYEHYEEDFNLLSSLNMNAYRFSIEWSRVQPQEGTWNVEAVQYYKSYIAALKKRKIEPVVTLFHFTLPTWFADKGGFEKRSNLKYFTQFVDRIIEEIGSQVRYIVIINEPEAYSFESYYLGHWPPARQSLWAALWVYHNLAVAHNRAAKLIHQKGKRHKVSSAKHFSYQYAGDDAIITRVTAQVANWFANDQWLRLVMKRCDFIAVNYYMSSRYYGYRVHNPNQTVSDMGWDMQPSDIEHVLTHLHEKYHKPIMITENGLADMNDTHRKWWLTETIIGIQKALAQDVNLLGYIHWSLLDNFEWDKGFWPHFGLFAVDPKTMKRTPRPSAQWFGKVIKKLRGMEV